MRSMRAVVAVLVFALQLLVAVPAAFAGLCDFDPGTHTINVQLQGSLTISRSGQNITLNGVVCHTVTTVDTIDADLGGQGNASIVWDLSHGPLAPGFTDEKPGEDPDSSEIEMNVTNPGPTGRATVIGGSEGESFTVGERSVGDARFLAFNFNGGDELFGEDEDAVIPGPVARIVLTGNSGGDLLSGAGTAVAGSHPVTIPMTISDGPGSDNVVGGDAADKFVPGPSVTEADSYDGGKGKDTLSFKGRTAAMLVTEDDNFNDGVHCPGATCEGDNVGPDVEKVVGGSGGDTITGSGAANVFNGGGGADTLKGAGGNDVLSGGPGNDALNGGPGTDTCKQGAGTGPKTACEL